MSIMWKTLGLYDLRVISRCYSTLKGAQNEKNSLHIGFDEQQRCTASPKQWSHPQLIHIIWILKWNATWIMSVMRNCSAAHLKYNLHASTSIEAAKWIKACKYVLLVLPLSLAQTNWIRLDVYASLHSCIIPVSMGKVSKILCLARTDVKSCVIHSSGRQDQHQAVKPAWKCGTRSVQKQTVNFLHQKQDITK